MILDYWENSDLFAGDPAVHHYSAHDIPHEDGYADILMCNHVLEHLPYRFARQAILEWGRVLKSGGFLFLTIPDLDACCQKIREVTDLHALEWAVHVLYGWQRDQNDQTDRLDSPLNEGEFHRCGFTEQSIYAYLTNAKFNVHEIMKYDGFGTPGLFIRAHRQ